MKTYVLTVSRHFPAYHPRKGDNTDFLTKIYRATGPMNKGAYKILLAKGYCKIHTIRSNYALWEGRIREVNAGKAVLSIRYWTGEPYKSKQKEFLQLCGNNVGIQKLQLDMLGWFIDDIDSDVTAKDLAKNDGLSTQDFKYWFKPKLRAAKASLKFEPLAIIHFTSFRYQNSEK